MITEEELSIRTKSLFATQPCNRSRIFNVREKEMEKKQKSRRRCCCRHNTQLGD